MKLITFLPHAPFRKKNVLSFLIDIVISMGKGEKANFLYVSKKNSSNWRGGSRHFLLIVPKALDVCHRRSGCVLVRDCFCDLTNFFDNIFFIQILKIFILKRENVCRMFVSISQKIKMTNSQPNLGKFHDLHVKLLKKMLLKKFVKSQKQSWTKTARSTMV